MAFLLICFLLKNDTLKSWSAMEHYQPSRWAMCVTFFSAPVHMSSAGAVLRYILLSLRDGKGIFKTSPFWFVIHTRPHALSVAPYCGPIWQCYCSSEWSSVQWRNSQGVLCIYSLTFWGVCLFVFLMLHNMSLSAFLLCFDLFILRLKKRRTYRRLLQRLWRNICISFDYAKRLF